eukprot:GHVH01004844.1.p1 GENE.GHVH01004844.1~~GHVH01004844.1.p1  ORF type:complete len:1214 (+),score=225.33 GHVH01004844.1:487-3642(+)
MGAAIWFDHPYRCDYDPATGSVLKFSMEGLMANNEHDQDGPSTEWNEFAWRELGGMDIDVLSVRSIYEEWNRANAWTDRVHGANRLSGLADFSGLEKEASQVAQRHIAVEFQNSVAPIEQNIKAMRSSWEAHDTALVEQLWSSMDDRKLAVLEPSEPDPGPKPRAAMQTERYEAVTPEGQFAQRMVDYVFDGLLAFLEYFIADDLLESYNLEELELLYGNDADVEEHRVEVGVAETLPTVVAYQRWRGSSRTLEIDSLPLLAHRIPTYWSGEERVGVQGVSILWRGVWNLTGDASKRCASLDSSTGEIWFAGSQTLNEVGFYLTGPDGPGYTSVSGVALVGNLSSPIEYTQPFFPRVASGSLHTVFGHEDYVSSPGWSVMIPHDREIIAAHALFAGRLDLLQDDMRISDEDVETMVHLFNTLDDPLRTRHATVLSVVEWFSDSRPTPKLIDGVQIPLSIFLHPQDDTFNSMKIQGVVIQNRIREDYRKSIRSFALKTPIMESRGFTHAALNERKYSDMSHNRLHDSDAARMCLSSLSLSTPMPAFEVDYTSLYHLHDETSRLKRSPDRTRELYRIVNRHIRGEWPPRADLASWGEWPPLHPDRRDVISSVLPGSLVKPNGAILHDQLTSSETDLSSEGFLSDSLSPLIPTPKSEDEKILNTLLEQRHVNPLARDLVRDQANPLFDGREATTWLISSRFMPIEAPMASVNELNKYGLMLKYRSDAPILTRSHMTPTDLKRLETISESWLQSIESRDQLLQEGIGKQIDDLMETTAEFLYSTGASSVESFVQMLITGDESSMDDKIRLLRNLMVTGDDALGSSLESHVGDMLREMAAELISDMDLEPLAEFARQGGHLSALPPSLMNVTFTMDFAPLVERFLHLVPDITKRRRVVDSFKLNVQLDMKDIIESFMVPIREGKQVALEKIIRKMLGVELGVGAIDELSAEQHSEEITKFLNDAENGEVLAESFLEMLDGDEPLYTTLELSDEQLDQLMAKMDKMDLKPNQNNDDDDDLIYFDISIYDDADLMEMIESLALSVEGESDASDESWNR